MIVYEHKEFDHEPQDLEIYQTGVDKFSKKEQAEVADEMTGEIRTVWYCDFVRYTLLEYIYEQQQVYSRLNDELTQTQVALCDVYEMLLAE